jgi:hypothetical protein
LKSSLDNRLFRYRKVQIPSKSPHLLMWSDGFSWFLWDEHLSSLVRFSPRLLFNSYLSKINLLYPFHLTTNITPAPKVLTDHAYFLWYQHLSLYLPMAFHFSLRDFLRLLLHAAVNNCVSPRLSGFPVSGPHFPFSVTYLLDLPSCQQRIHVNEILFLWDWSLMPRFGNGSG